MAQPTGTAGGTSFSTPGGARLTGGRAQYVAVAAQRYGVPIPILLGVWGKETDFGKLVSTSSAGAVGEFQFIPSTAASYNYPLTNTPNDAQFRAQANAAAKYLSDLFHQTHSWNTALQRYSGGGYGLADVQAEAKGKAVVFGGQASLGGPFGSALDALTNPPSIANPVAGALSGIFNQAVSDAKYAAVLVAALVAGVYLITHGLTGQAKPQGQANVVISMARKARA